MAVAGGTARNVALAGGDYPVIRCSTFATHSECGIGFGTSYLRRNAKSAALNFRIAPKLPWLRYTTETWNEQEFVQTRCTLIWLEVRPQVFLPEAPSQICFEPSGDLASPSWKLFHFRL